LEGWRAWSADQTFLPFATRLWGWSAIALLPLFISVFRPRRSFIPVAVALALSIALPWCMRSWMQDFNYGTYFRKETLTGPNLLAHALVELGG
jgi:hypothetical protein